MIHSDFHFEKPFWQADKRCKASREGKKTKKQSPLSGPFIIAYNLAIWWMGRGKKTTWWARRREGEREMSEYKQGRVHCWCLSKEKHLAPTFVLLYSLLLHCGPANKLPSWKSYDFCFKEGGGGGCWINKTIMVQSRAIINLTPLWQPGKAAGLSDRQKQGICWNIHIPTDEGKSGQWNCQSVEVGEVEVKCIHPHKNREREREKSNWHQIIATS